KYTKKNNNKNVFYLAEILKEKLEKQKKFQEIFEIKLKKNEKFQTLSFSIILKNSKKIFFHFDIATLRDEKYDFSGALPTVIRTDDFSKDIKRRDITINSIAIQLNSDKNFKLKIIDIYNGFDDLKNKKIKLNYKTSLIDDPTRIFRIIRFAKRLDFNFDKQTEKNLKNAIKNKFYDRISKTRVLNELKKIFEETKYTKIFIFMYESGLIKSINKKFRKNTKNLQKILKNFKKFDDFLFYLQIYDFELEFEKWFIYFLIICKDLNLSTRRQIVKDFNFSQDKKENLLINLDKFKNFHNFPIKKYIKKRGKSKFEDLKNLKNSEIYFLLQNLNTNFIIFLIVVSENKTLQSKFLNYLLITKNIKLRIDGNFIKNLGIKDGKKISEILKKILTQKLDYGFKNKETEEAFAKNFVSKIKRTQNL
ncbi:MAG: hypothetical protein LBF97_03715, partial [Elusimicrobiota bacterium]|nr:hypothetical protein [Elusimicrobiota bacterium]